jgi:hypothetical protein
MDSLLVLYELTAPDNTVTFDTFKIAPLPVNSIVTFQHPVTTSGPVGLYQIRILVNPGYAQKEQQLFNNVGTKYFYTYRDIKGPYVDAAFDGKHILDNALVSAKPQIDITIRDENKFIPLADTGLFQLQLILPDNSSVPLNFSSQWITFLPANLNNGKNEAHILLAPPDLQDGTYTLAVKVRDASGNISAPHDWSKRFKIINKQMATHAINFPNPFSTSTRWLYTLTGSSPVSAYQVRIMTISGKVVRELNAVDLGILTPGEHLTDGSWNGQDMFGQQLANGVYLYQFRLLNQDNQDIDIMESDVNAYMEKGFGKLVIMR